MTDLGAGRQSIRLVGMNKDSSENIFSDCP